MSKEAQKQHIEITRESERELLCSLLQFKPGGDVDGWEAWAEKFMSSEEERESMSGVAVGLFQSGQVADLRQNVRWAEDKLDMTQKSAMALIGLTSLGSLFWKEGEERDSFYDQVIGPRDSKSLHRVFLDNFSDLEENSLDEEKYLTRTLFHLIYSEWGRVQLSGRLSVLDELKGEGKSLEKGDRVRAKEIVHKEALISLMGERLEKARVEGEGVEMENFNKMLRLFVIGVAMSQLYGTGDVSVAEGLRVEIEQILTQDDLNDLKELGRELVDKELKSKKNWIVWGGLLMSLASTGVEIHNGDWEFGINETSDVVFVAVTVLRSIAIGKVFYRRRRLNKSVEKLMVKSEIDSVEQSR